MRSRIMDKLNLNQLEPWKQELQNSFSSAFDQIINWAPKLLGMIVVLAVGYIVARILDRAVTALSESLGLETAAERSGLTTSMKQVGIERSVSSK